MRKHYTIQEAQRLTLATCAALAEACADNPQAAAARQLERDAAAQVGQLAVWPLRDITQRGISIAYEAGRNKNPIRCIPHIEAMTAAIEAWGSAQSSVIYTLAVRGGDLTCDIRASGSIWKVCGDDRVCVSNGHHLEPKDQAVVIMVLAALRLLRRAAARREDEQERDKLEQVLAAVMDCYDVVSLTRHGELIREGHRRTLPALPALPHLARVHQAIKKAHPDKVVLMRCGSTYETADNGDAHILRDVCGAVLYQGKDGQLFACVQAAEIDDQCAALWQAGHSIVIAERPQGRKCYNLLNPLSHITAIITPETRTYEQWPDCAAFALRAAERRRATA